MPFIKEESNAIKIPSWSVRTTSLHTVGQFYNELCHSQCCHKVIKYM